RLFIEQNFTFVDTFALIAVARYIFELSVWLNLFKLDARYGLVYFHQLILTQQRSREDMKAQLEREILLLNSFENLEKEAHSKAIEQIKGLPEGNPRRAAFAETLKSLSEAIDLDAAKHFSIY